MVVIGGIEEQQLRTRGKLVQKGEKKQAWKNTHDILFECPKIN